MNEEKMIEVLARIENQEGGVGHDQSHWFRQTPCGTTACLAGHTALMEGYVVDWSYGYYSSVSGAVSPPDKPDLKYTTSKVAAQVLELNPQESHLLFHTAQSLDDIYKFAARSMGVDEQVLRDKVQDQVTS